MPQPKQIRLAINLLASGRRDAPQDFGLSLEATLAASRAKITVESWPWTSSTR